MRNRPSLIWLPPTRTASSKIIRLSMATNGVASWLPPYSWRQTAFGSMAASVMPLSRPSPWRPVNRRCRIFPPGSNGPLSHRRLNDVYSPPTPPSTRPPIRGGSPYPARGDDWPQWVEPRRDGVWRKAGVVQAIPATGLPVKWRVPAKGGYSGPAVADG